MRNKLEEKVAKALPIGFEYEAIKLPYTINHKYLPDFVNRQTMELIEVKGRFCAADRRKMLAVKTQNPEWDITMAFQNPNAPIAKDSETTNADWCEKNGIKWRKA